jgi:hypothetical protein
VLNETMLKKAEGIFRGESIASDFYHVQDVQGRLNVDRQKIELLDLVGKIYGGEMKGQVLIDRQALVSYIVWMEFTHLQSAKLQEINPMFSQVNAEFNGTFRMKHDGENIQFFNAELNLAKPGEISSSLLKKIVTEPATLNKTGGLDLVTQGKPKVTFDNAQVYLQNTGLVKVIVGVELKKKEGDFDIRALHEITTPEGIEPFLFRDIKTDLSPKGNPR